MAKVGPQRAAELTGVSKSTVQRAMKAGKLSYEIDNAGRRVIDVSELERVFGLAPQGTHPPAAAASVESELEKAASMIETERMKMRIRMLEDQLEVSREHIEDLKEQRDQWQKQAQQVLITSQYSQKQAEELKEELKERDRRAHMRRQAEAQQRRGAPTGQPVSKSAAKPATGEAPIPTEKRRIGPFGRQKQAVAEAVSLQAVPPTAQTSKAFDIQGLWQKIRGESVANNTDAPADAAKDKASA